MKPAPIGTRILVVSKSNQHSYRIGRTYRVTRVDSDGTFRAADEHGVEGDFLTWEDCRPAGIGWEWLRGQLDARSLDLLSAFEGVENLSLRPDIETGVIATIPNLAEEILNTLPALEETLDPQEPDEDDPEIAELAELFGES